MKRTNLKIGIIGFLFIIIVLIISGCTFNTDNLINQKNNTTGDIVQYTVDIQQANNNNSYHVIGMMENKGATKYSDVNLTVIGYNANKEKVAETKIMLSSMPAHDYTNYDAWLSSPNGEKITTARVEVINATPD